VERIRIRKGSPADVETIVGFNLAMARESEGTSLDPEVLRRGVERALSDPASEARYYVAEDEDGPVGQTMVTREWSDWRCGWFWWIQSVFVREDRRGTGVFRALFDQIAKEAKKRPDVVGLRLYVDRDNRGAQRVYERLGMSRTAYDLFEIQWRGSGARSDDATERNSG
jgi:GNAT superfamily N-acetyltransferase